MNVIQEITEKYSGHYSEEPERKTHTISGLFTNQLIQGQFEVKGAKIKLVLNDVGGATPEVEPFQLYHYLGEKVSVNLNIYPKSFWTKVFSNLSPSKCNHLSFKGNKVLIKDLLSDPLFLEDVKDEEMYIRIDTKNRIQATQERGFHTVEHIEKYIRILIRVEKAIKNQC